MYPSSTRFLPCSWSTHVEQMFWPGTHTTSPMRPLFLAQDVNGLPESTAGMSQMQIVWGCHEELSPPTYMAYTTICTSRRRLPVPSCWERRLQNSRLIHRHIFQLRMVDETQNNRLQKVNDSLTQAHILQIQSPQIFHVWRRLSLQEQQSGWVLQGRMSSTHCHSSLCTMGEWSDWKR